MGQRNPDCVFEQLDPRCKLMIVLLVTTLLLFGDAVVSCGLFVAAGGLAVCSRLTRFFVGMTLLSAALWTMFLMIFHVVLKRPLQDPVSLFYGIVFRGTALSVTGLWFAVTTKLRDFTAAMEAWKLPVIIVLPLTIAVRFIPTLFHELLIIRDSMRLRKLYHRKRDLFKHPEQFFHRYIGLVIIRSLKMADELAAVAETRGLARPQGPRFYRPAQFRRNDYLAMGLTAGYTVLLIVLWRLV